MHDEGPDASAASTAESQHYTTFDGRHWHFTDGNSRSRTLVTVYKSTTRDFVVQAQVVGSHAIACALAGREGHDRVMINACNGNVALEKDFHSQKVADQPRIDVSGNTYTAYFKSGAWMRAQVHGRYMNLYVESVDPGESCGMCGDFNSNNKTDAVTSTVDDYNELKPCQKVGGAGCTVGANSGRTTPCSIWSYKAAANPRTTPQPDKPPAARMCAYTTTSTTTTTTTTTFTLPSPPPLLPPPPPTPPPPLPLPR